MLPTADDIPNKVKVVFITEAGRGIGKGIAPVLAPGRGCSWMVG